MDFNLGAGLSKTIKSGQYDDRFSPNDSKIKVTYYQSENSLNTSITYLL